MVANSDNLHHCHKALSFCQLKNYAPSRQMTRIEKAPNLSSNLRTVEKTASKFALEHFDDFYKKIFKTDWPSIRLALLSKSKFCAVLNHLADTVTKASALVSLLPPPIQSGLELAKAYNFLAYHRVKWHKSYYCSNLLKLTFVILFVS